MTKNKKMQNIEINGKHISQYVLLALGFFIAGHWLVDSIQALQQAEQLVTGSVDGKDIAAASFLLTIIRVVVILSVSLFAFASSAKAFYSQVVLYLFLGSSYLITGLLQLYTMHLRGVEEGVPFGVIPFQPWPFFVAVTYGVFLSWLYHKRSTYYK